MQVKIKRVYDPAEEADGYRVLVDKLWPRGVRKEDFRYDLWAKEIAPSTPLRQWYHADPAGRWAEFRTKYLQELEHSAAVGRLLEQIGDRKTVTLLYASHNAAENHALILRDFLEGRPSKSTLR